MAEKMKDFQHRMESEGLWVEFCAEKTRCMTQLMNEGTTKNVERLAWKMAAVKFPPPADAIAVSSVIENAPSRVKKAGRKKAVDPQAAADALAAMPIPDELAYRECSVFDAYQWVFNAIGRPNIEPIHAPSIAAWHLLTQVKSNPELYTKFVTQLMPKLFPKAAQLEAELLKHDDGRTDLDLVNRLIREKEGKNASENAGSEQVSTPSRTEESVQISEVVSGSNDSERSEEDSGDEQRTIGVLEPVELADDEL